MRWHGEVQSITANVNLAPHFRSRTIALWPSYLPNTYGFTLLDSCAARINSSLEPGENTESTTLISIKSPQQGKSEGLTSRSHTTNAFIQAELSDHRFKLSVPIVGPTLFRGSCADMNLAHQISNHTIYLWQMLTQHTPIVKTIILYSEQKSKFLVTKCDNWYNYQ